MAPLTSIFAAGGPRCRHNATGRGRPAAARRPRRPRSEGVGGRAEVAPRGTLLGTAAIRQPVRVGPARPGPRTSKALGRIARGLAEDGGEGATGGRRPPPPEGGCEDGGAPPLGPSCDRAPAVSRTPIPNWPHSLSRRARGHARGVLLLGKVYCQLELIQVVAAAAVTELSIFLQLEGGCAELIRRRDKLLSVLCERLYQRYYWVHLCTTYVLSREYKWGRGVARGKSPGFPLNL
jgi:hypothetical protein